MDPGTLAAKWIGVVCMFEWGIIHCLAGFMTIPPGYANQLGQYGVNICSKASDEQKAEALAVRHWPVLVQRPLIQHGWNLLFVGIWALVLSVANIVQPMHRDSMWFSLFPLLADIGYIFAIEVPDLADIVGSAQTYILATAVTCFNYTVKVVHGDLVPDWEYALGYCFAGTLFAAAVAVAMYKIISPAVKSRVME